MDLLKRGTVALLLGTEIWRGVIEAIIHFYFIMEIVLKAQKMKFDKTDTKSNTITKLKKQKYKGSCTSLPNRNSCLEYIGSA